MAEELSGPDAGISYNEAPTAIQKLLKKVQARKHAVGEETDRSMNGLPQVAFSRGEYAARFQDRIAKEMGHNILQRKAGGLFMRPWLSQQPPEGPGSWLWQGIRNDAAREIRTIKRTEPGRYRNLRGFSSISPMISFGEWDTKYPKSVLQTVWRKLSNKSKLPSSTARLDFKKYPAANWGEMHRRISGYRMSAMLDEILLEGADPRPRNTLGEFVPPTEGGPDRNAIATTYGNAMARKQSGMGREITQAVLAAPLVGAGGTAGGLAIKSLFNKLNPRKALKKPI